MSKRICAFCGGEFTGAVTARYCSRACTSGAQRARVARNGGNPYGVTPKANKATCAYCGEGFNPKRPSARYCSPAHRQAAYRARKQRKQKAVA